MRSALLTSVAGLVCGLLAGSGAARSTWARSHRAELEPPDFAAKTAEHMAARVCVSAFSAAEIARPGSVLDFAQPTDLS